MKEGEKVIYENVRKLCEKKGVSIYRLEKDLEFSPSSIVKWKTSKPSVDKMQKVADYFGVPIEYFVEGSD